MFSLSVRCRDREGEWTTTTLEKKRRGERAKRTSEANERTQTLSHRWSTELQGAVYKGCKCRKRKTQVTGLVFVGNKRWIYWEHTLPKQKQLDLIRGPNNRRSLKTYAVYTLLYSEYAGLQSMLLWMVGYVFPYSTSIHCFSYSQHYRHVDLHCRLGATGFLTQAIKYLLHEWYSTIAV